MDNRNQVFVEETILSIVQIYLYVCSLAASVYVLPVSEIVRNVLYLLIGLSSFILLLVWILQADEVRSNYNVWAGTEEVSVPATVITITHWRDGTYRRSNVCWKRRNRQLNANGWVALPSLHHVEDRVELWVNRKEEKLWDRRVERYFEQAEQLPGELDDLRMNDGY